MQQSIQDWGGRCNSCPHAPTMNKTDFTKIIYNDVYHSYEYEGHILESVTTVIKRFIPRFPRKEILARKAAETGRTIQEIQNQWDKKGEYSMALGTLVHAYVESLIDGRVDPVVKRINTLHPQIHAADNCWEELRSKFDAILYKKEWIIGDVDFQVGGRIDVILDLKIRDQRKLCIVDWKTGKFSDDKLIHYSWQTSLYRLIIERNTELQLYDPYIIHFRDDGKFMLYPTYDFRDKLLEGLSNGCYNSTTEKHIKGVIIMLSKINQSVINNVSKRTARALSAAMSNCANMIEETLLDRDE